MTYIAKCESKIQFQQIEISGYIFYDKSYRFSVIGRVQKSFM